MGAARDAALRYGTERPELQGALRSDESTVRASPHFIILCNICYRKANSLRLAGSWRPYRSVVYNTQVSSTRYQDSSHIGHRLRQRRATARVHVLYGSRTGYTPYLHSRRYQSVSAHAVACELSTSGLHRTGFAAVSRHGADIYYTASSVVDKKYKSPVKGGRKRA